MPMHYFGGIGQRARIDSPYLDDDCDIVAPQFNVWVYTDSVSEIDVRIASKVVALPREYFCRIAW